MKGQDLRLWTDTNWRCVSATMARALRTPNTDRGLRINQRKSLAAAMSGAKWRLCFDRLRECD